MATTVTLKPNAIDISGSTSGTTTLQATAVAGTTTLTLPAATDTLVGKATTDTLTNKTLTSPTITGGALNGTVGATTPSTGAFTTLSATGNVTLGDASTDTLNVGNGGLIKDASGNLGLGVTPSAWFSSYKAFQINTNGSLTSNTDFFAFTNNAFVNSVGDDKYLTSAYAGRYRFVSSNGQHQWFNAPSGTGGATPDTVSFTQAMTLDTNGNLVVGATSAYDASYRGIQAINTTGGDCAVFTTTGFSGTVVRWNKATSGDNQFIDFFTETSITPRGSITYNRAGGLVAYNVTSDYRAKDIIGPVTDSGALIDATPVYMGKMKGATQERPMFIAHETPNYAHTGEKDAVDADGKPVYQQMDTSALIPVMWAEIQSLRKRLAAANL
jgi:hypothetical protein